VGVVYNDDQWVSYDDAESFKLKVDYLDKIVGGSFVWSVDQDDVIYTAISALYRT
jgi:chitinase